MKLPQHASAKEDTSCYICKYNHYCTDAIFGVICIDYRGISKKTADDLAKEMKSNQKRIDDLSDTTDYDKIDEEWRRLLSSNKL